MTVPVLLALGIVAGSLTASGLTDVPSLLREIRKEVASLEKYPGEDFARGEFFLGEGDDDTNKTHAVGILVKEEGGGARMTIVVSRLEPARDDPRVKYAREPRTVVCAFAAGAAGVEIVRSDYPAEELDKLLPAILKAVLDKKALLKKEGDPRAKPQEGFPGPISP
jgi:hypothetical protein